MFCILLSMNFKVAPTLYQKMSLLADSTRFEPAGSEPHAEMAASIRPHAPKTVPCVSEVSTPSGKKPILKAMLTTACERNCFYCPFRAGRNETTRVTFQPDEMATVFHNMERSRVVEGLFLSSGIIKGGVTTQDKIIDTAEILRRKYQYRGYIHLKIMPGAEYEQVHRAMLVADRVSINLEAPTPQRLAALAPKKEYWQELVQPLKWASQIRQAYRLSTSLVTQFVVGAVGDTDVELLQTSAYLYNQLGAKRTYYSAFHPVNQTPFENLPATPLQREFRLYQASFLIRDYGWSFEDLPFQEDANLPLAIDPKLAWAESNLQDSPIDINTASRAELMRVPGIGPAAASLIITSRSRGKVTELPHLRAMGIRDIYRAAPYILINGKRPAQQLPLF
jgi:predicted DNA-binding helix-hairpin-helix protein